jgi:hypothetical protein
MKTLKFTCEISCHVIRFFQVCSVLPSVVRDQCDNLVETYGPAIVEILSRDIDAKDVCTLMQLCDSKAEGKLIIIRVNAKFEFQVRQRKPVRNSYN